MNTKEILLLASVLAAQSANAAEPATKYFIPVKKNPFTELCGKTKCIDTVFSITEDNQHFLTEIRIDNKVPVLNTNTAYDYLLNDLINTGVIHDEEEIINLDVNNNTIRILMERASDTVPNIDFIRQ